MAEPRNPRTDPQPGDTYTLKHVQVTYTVRERDGYMLVCDRTKAGRFTNSADLTSTGWGEDAFGLGVYARGDA